jgi:hypothetical protein
MTRGALQDDTLRRQARLVRIECGRERANVQLGKDDAAENKNERR